MARLVIDLDGLANNARRLRDYCEGRGLTMLPVLKGAGFDAEVARVARDAGGAVPAAAHPFGVQAVHEALGERAVLLTMPPCSRAEAIVAHAYRSFVSEPAAIRALSLAAQRAGIPHEVVLFVDVGDLREGCLPAQLSGILREAVSLEHDYFRVAGLATNFGCLTGLRPSHEAMECMDLLAAEAARVLGRTPDVLSLGGSILLPWMAEHELPACATELRLGETLLLGHFQDEHVPVAGLTPDPVQLEGEVLEVARKPTSRDGAYGPNALGELTRPQDRGERLRALLDFGVLDTKPWELSCRTLGVEYVGATSNYAVFDVESADPVPKPGDRLLFSMGYEALARAFHSRYLECRHTAALAGIS